MWSYYINGTNIIGEGEKSKRYHIDNTSNAADFRVTDPDVAIVHDCANDSFQATLLNVGILRVHNMDALPGKHLNLQ